MPGFTNTKTPLFKHSRHPSTKVSRRKVKMGGRIKFVFVAFFAAVMIGAGVVVAQTYRLPSPGYTAVSIAAVLNQNTGPSDNSQATTTPRLTHHETDLDSLNLTRTQVTKEDLQNQINMGFTGWMFKNPQRLLRSFNADNETFSSLFFQFMAENPRYQELFVQYDRLLSEEIGVQMMKFAQETSKYVNLITAEGKVVREWNKTITINNTTYTYVYRDYALEINGTTQHVLKVSVYTSDGTLIIDPKIMITQAPLYYWLPWPWCYPVLYGYDFGMYVHFTPEETPVYLNNAFIVLMTEPAQSSWSDIGLYISAIGFIASLIALSPTAVLGATGLILSLQGKSKSEMAKQIWNDISTVAALNAREDPSYGFQLFQRFHYVASYCWYDPLSWTTFHIIYYNGVVLQTCPRTGVNYITDSTVLSAYVNFMWWYSANVGFGH